MLIRYPGGKQKLAHQIVSWIKEQCVQEGISQYREPFFGAGAIGFELLEDFEQIKSIRINDKDPGIACLWYAVYHELPNLLKRIDEYDEWLQEKDDYKKDEVTNLTSIHRSSQKAAEEFREWRDKLKGLKKMPSRIDRLYYGAMKLACHQMSFSGLGTVTGPIGGWDQESKYGIGCRYFTKSLKANAIEANRILKRLDFGPTKGHVCTAESFEKVFAEPGDCIFYVDPPYYEQGPSLYQCSFNVKDHEELSKLLEAEDRPWLLSYDVRDEVRSLYKFTPHIIETPLTYTVAWKDREKEGITVEPKKRMELVISNRSLKDFKPPLPKKTRAKPALEAAV